MKNTITTLAFLFLCSLIIGQDYHTTIGIKLNPGIATIYKPIVRNISYARFSACAGIEVRQRVFQDKFYLESGVYLLDKGFAISTYYNDVLNNKQVAQSSREMEYYVSLPISFIFKHNGIYFGAGPNINYYLARNFFLNGKLISKDKSYQPNDIVFGIQALTGYELKLSKKMFLAFEGYISPTLKVKYLNYGLGFGIKYALTKKTP
jgi:hypothetical protein